MSTLNVSTLSVPFVIVTCCVLLNFSVCIHNGSSLSLSVYSNVYLPVSFTFFNTQVLPVSTAVVELSLYHLNVFVGLFIPGPSDVAVNVISPVPYSNVSVPSFVKLFDSVKSAVALGLSHTAYNVISPYIFAGIDVNGSLSPLLSVVHPTNLWLLSAPLATGNAVPSA